MKKYLKIPAFVALVFLQTYSGAAFSCAFHGGYGFGAPMANYGSSWDESQLNSELKQAAATPKRTLWYTLPTMVNTKIGEIYEFTIGYEKLQDSDKVAISVDTAPEVSLARVSQIDIDSTNGKITYSITPTKAGMFKMVVVVSEKADSNLSDQTKVFYLQVTI